MCLLNLAHRPPRWLPLSLLLITLAWAAYLLPDVVGHVPLGEIADSLSMKTRSVEEAREIGGLLLVALWSAIVWCFNR
jgi:Transmembrane family 220, helix